MQDQFNMLSIILRRAQVAQTIEFILYIRPTKVKGQGIVNLKAVEWISWNTVTKAIQRVAQSLEMMHCCYNEREYNWLLSLILLTFKLFTFTLARKLWKLFFLWSSSYQN